jgi:hypothetical protein
VESEAEIRPGRIDEAKRMYSIMRASMSDAAIREIAVLLFDEAEANAMSGMPLLVKGSETNLEIEDTTDYTRPALRMD